MVYAKLGVEEGGGGGKQSLLWGVWKWIDHFTVLCSVTRPLNKREAGVDLALIQTSLLFLCKSCCCNANEFKLT